MALFNRESDKNVKPAMQSAVPHQAHPDFPAPPAITPSPETRAAETRAGAARPIAASEGRAYLDSGSKVSGKLHFEGPVRLDGQIEGEIQAKESLVIGESAVITAQIKGASVVVAGKVSGDITATQRIEIRPSAKVLGNLSAPVLVIQEGALFEGHCAMQAEGGHERKVTVFPKEERLAQAAGQKSA